MDDQDIPETLIEAIGSLLATLSADQQTKILALEENEFIAISHFVLGLWVRNRWVYPAKTGWFADSRKSAIHNDDISAFVCKQLHRAVHGKAISDAKVCPSWMDDVDE